MGFAVFVISALVYGITVCNGFIIYHGTQREVSATLRVTNGGAWGTWSIARYCPDGSYARGYNMKIEAFQGYYDDDTALNAIELLCESPAGTFGGEVYAKEGPFGTWRNPKNCIKNGEFLNAFTLQVEPSQGHHDDTAANYIKFDCVRNDNSVYAIGTTGHGKWGSYGNPSSKCPSGSAICGLMTRVESNQGDGDDTALNDVVFYCCEILA